MERSKIVFDYSKLKGLIVEKYGSATAFAEKVGIAPSRLSLKLNNQFPFSQSEIYTISINLGIENNWEYFFTPKC